MTYRNISENGMQIAPLSYMKGVLLFFFIPILSARGGQRTRERPIFSHLEATAPSLPFLLLLTIMVRHVGRQVREVFFSTPQIVKAYSGESMLSFWLLDIANHLNR